MVKLFRINWLILKNKKSSGFISFYSQELANVPLMKNKQKEVRRRGGERGMIVEGQRKKKEKEEGRKGGRKDQNGREIISQLDFSTSIISQKTFGILVIERWEDK